MTLVQSHLQPLSGNKKFKAGRNFFFPAFVLLKG